jgi:hypothetical protein
MRDAGFSFISTEIGSTGIHNRLNIFISHRVYARKMSGRPVVAQHCRKALVDSIRRSLARQNPRIPRHTHFYDRLCLQARNAANSKTQTRAQSISTFCPALLIPPSHSCLTPCKSIPSQGQITPEPTETMTLNSCFNTLLSPSIVIG